MFAELIQADKLLSWEVWREAQKVEVKAEVEKEKKADKLLS